MNLSQVGQQTLQLFAWFSALIEFVLAFYVLVLNMRHSANRIVSCLFVIFALFNAGIGGLLVATSAAQAYLPTILLAITQPLIAPVLFIVSLILLSPEWLRGRGRWLWYVGWLIFMLPIPFGLMDLSFGTGLWYVGLDVNVYQGGFVNLSDYATGILASPLTIVFVYIAPFITTFYLGYIAFFSKKVSELGRGLARLMFLAQVAVLLSQFSLRAWVAPEIYYFISNTIFVLFYGYAAFKQMVSERRFQQGSFRARLTVVVLGITAPILVGIVILLGAQAGVLIEQIEIERLQAINHSLAVNTSTWLDYNVKALELLAARPEIVSMDAEQQVLALRELADVYPYMYLISTTDLNGQNVARSDFQDLFDYGESEWFLKIRDGASSLGIVAVEHNFSRPSLVVTVPIWAEGERVGVLMFATALSSVAEQLQISPVGERGLIYIVDSQERVLAHPDIAMTAKVNDFGDQPAVQALRVMDPEQLPLHKFNIVGESWWAYVDKLANGWGVVVQQPESELLLGLQYFRRLSWSILSVGIALLLGLFSLAVRQAFLPIETLTETASAIAEGDISREVAIESGGEIGRLAQSFNSMAMRLRDLIDGLEKRVAERTQEIERRAEYLAVTGRVSRVAASILDVDVLLERVVHLISERFKFYHTGIFLIDAAGEWALLQAASSEGGQRMLKRGHRLRVGEEGIVGYVSSSGSPRIALDVDADTVWVKNPDLPLTRSEMALPLIAGEQTIGILDVQSVEPEAFVMEDVTTLQILADQIAVAIQNARLFQDNRQAIQELQDTYGGAVRRGWLQRSSRLAGYRYTPLENLPIFQSELQVADFGTITEVVENNVLQVPLRLIGGYTFGALRIRRAEEIPWTTREIEFVDQAAQNIAQGLEVARLFEETRMRADRDRLVGEVEGQLRSSLDPDEILQTTVRELGRILGAQLASIEIVNPEQG